jgi:hypothetical protein
MSRENVFGRRRKRLRAAGVRAVVFQREGVAAEIGAALEKLVDK